MFEQNILQTPPEVNAKLREEDPRFITDESQVLIKHDFMGKYVRERHCLELQTKEKRRFFGRKYENKPIKFERRVLWSNEIKFEEIDRQVAKRKPTNQEQLFQIVQNVWNNMEPGRLLKLCDRMPRVLKIVIAAEGDILMRNMPSESLKTSLCIDQMLI